MKFFSCMWTQCFPVRVASCVILLLRWFIVCCSFFCHVWSVLYGNCDFTKGHSGTKARKSVEFNCEDEGAAGTVESVSGSQWKSSWNSERNHAKKTPWESREAKEGRKTKCLRDETNCKVSTRSFQPLVLVARFYFSLQSIVRSKSPNQQHTYIHTK